MTLRPCTTSSPCRDCEARDCDSDRDCETGLLCADAHEDALTAIGLDPRKAYCDPNSGRWNFEFCYDPKKLDCKVGNKCTECEARDCDTDAECSPGLKCADAHEDLLTAVGLDPRKAYCDKRIGLANEELCYDPKKVITDCTGDAKCSVCEARDCDTDDQCGTGLKCADAHKDELTRAGFDPRKAHCDPSIGLSNWELCYDPTKLVTDCTRDDKCRECEARDCDTDDQCRRGLLCADQHKDELTRDGFDPRKANCNENIGLWNWELCYDPKKLKA